MRKFWLSVGSAGLALSAMVGFIVAGMSGRRLIRSGFYVTNPVIEADTWIGSAFWILLACSTAVLAIATVIVFVEGKGEDSYDKFRP